MPLSPGTTLGPYQVTAKIGEGGMGEVYRATDTSLDRQVAIKVLPDAFASDAERLARFEREAKVLASLNHPNIGAIYGLEKSGDTQALILELVEGPTLADRIAQGPIPIDEALPIAKQIAEALEAAHEQGIIHRDLKPANIKVKEDGTVKVLDFGLAKAFQPDASDVSASMSPTISLTAAATQMGMVIGTAAYMAPEQAKGKVVDKRVDVWAFGAVLYEMLTETRPFAGDDVSETLARVIDREPDWAVLPDNLPPGLSNVLRHCLQKNPKKRIRDIGDVSLAMEGAFETTVSTSVGAFATPPLRVWQRPTQLSLGAVLLVAVSGLAVWSLTRPGPPEIQPTKRFVITQSASNAITQGGARGTLFALSPDGRTLVYRGANEGGTQLYRRSLDQLEVVPIPGTENAARPAFSPDGQWVTFYAGAEGPLMKVSLAGGPALTILQDPLSRFGRAHAWGPDDTIVFGTDSGLFQVSANGGDAEPLTTPESEGESHFDPRFLPAGKALLFVLRSPPANDNQLAVYSFETGESRQLLVAGLRPRYSLGHIVFARLDSLWAVPFDANRLEITGDPFLVLQGVAAFTGFASQFDMAHDGTLVYVPTGALGSRRERTLGWVDRDGVSTPLRDEPRVYYAPRFSPDGRRLLLRISDTDRGTNDLWVQDVERDTLTPLTFEGSPNEFPIWTSDGERVTFTSARGEEPMQLYERPADGSGDVELLLDKEGRQYPSSWSPDGTVLAFIDIHPDTGDDIWLLEDGVPRAFIATDASETMAMFSPDGQWLAYQSNKSGPNEVYLTPYPGPGGEQQVSTEGGRSPVWSPDGSELFYRTDAGQVLSVSVQTTPLVELSATQLLFEIPNMASMDSANSAFDVHPDGERFVVVRSVGSESSTTQINVVLNWLEERAERVPTP